MAFKILGYRLVHYGMKKGDNNYFCNIFFSNNYICNIFFSKIQTFAYLLTKLNELSRPGAPKSEHLYSSFMKERLFFKVVSFFPTEIHNSK